MLFYTHRVSELQPFCEVSKGSISSIDAKKTLAPRIMVVVVGWGAGGDGAGENNIILMLLLIMRLIAMMTIITVTCHAWMY